MAGHRGPQEGGDGEEGRDLEWENAFVLHRVEGSGREGCPSRDRSSRAEGEEGAGFSNCCVTLTTTRWRWLPKGKYSFSIFFFFFKARGENLRRLGHPVSS